MNLSIWSAVFALIGVGLIPVPSMAQNAGDLVSGHVALQQARGGGTVARIPLPPGQWEVVDSILRKSNGNQAADLRDVRLIQVAKDEQGPVLQHALEITMKVEGPNIRWTDEPCKITPLLASNDYGTRLFQQKCLTLIPDRFLQNNNASTQRLLATLAQRGVRHDFNALALTYTRYGDFGYFLIVRQFFFPSRYGLDNPRTGMLNESPWHPSRVALDPARKKLVDAVFKYGEQMAPVLDRAYLREEAGSIGQFEF